MGRIAENIAEARRDRSRDSGGRRGRRGRRGWLWRIVVESQRIFVESQRIFFKSRRIFA